MKATGLRRPRGSANCATLHVAAIDLQTRSFCVFYNLHNNTAAMGIWT